MKPKKDGKQKEAPLDRIEEAWNHFLDVVAEEIARGQFAGAWGSEYNPRSRGDRAAMRDMVETERAKMREANAWRKSK